MNGNQSIRTVEDFWQDTMDCWQRLPNKTFFFVLLAAWLALFQFLGNSILGYVHTPSLFSWMYEAYNPAGQESDDAHGNFIPFLVVGIFWWKRHELLTSQFKLWIPGLLILVLGIVLHILAYTLQLPHFSIIALFIGIYGLMGLAWGPQWLRKSIFPFFLFIFSVPLGQHGTVITFPLQMLVTRLVELTAHIFGIGVLRSGTELFDPSGSFQYDVAPACSGIRSLMAFFLLTTVYGFFCFQKGWKRLFFMALAVPLAIMGNMLRLLMVITTAVIGGQKLGDFFHDNFFTSLVSYVPVFIVLFLVARWLEYGDIASLWTWPRRLSLFLTGRRPENREAQPLKK
jgi:exosortase